MPSLVYSLVIPTLKKQEEVVSQIQEMLCSTSVPLEIIATCQPVSAAKNRNIGLKRATSSLIFMVDDDVTGFPENWAERLLETMNRQPLCYMVSPRLMAMNGKYGYMTGYPSDNYTGDEVLKKREICTACVLLRKTEILFDENFVGSGFEDNDYCRQLVQRYPEAQFICVHDLRVIHKNEGKNQRGHNWAKNQRYYEKKWGKWK